MLGATFFWPSPSNPNDPVNAAWDLYNKFSLKGFLFIKVFHFRIVLVGDFDTLRFLFNHPDVQARTGANFHTDTLTKMMKEERGVLLVLWRVSPSVRERCGQTREDSH